MGYSDVMQRLKTRLVVKHDASAASNGVAVRVLQRDGIYRLVCENANNADAIYSGTVIGPDKKSASETAIVNIVDVAAGSGVALYYDETVTDPARRFNAVIPTLGDAFIEFSNGTMMQVVYKAVATGVQVYFDDDAASSTLRLLAVLPSAANSNAETSNERATIFAVQGA